MKNKKLSIIITVYNLEKWIEECLNSLEPLYNNNEIEIIIINDGSTDNSLEIIKNKTNNTKIQIFTKENSGLSNSRNFAINKCSGEYLWFVDGDDEIISEDFQVLLLEMNGINDILHFKITTKDDITGQIEESSWFKGVNNQIEDYAFLRKRGFDISPWSRIFKKEIFLKYNWPQIINEDFFLMSEIYFNNNKLKKVFLNGFFYRYRINRSGSLLSNVKENKEKYTDKIFEYIKDMDTRTTQFITGMYLLTSKLPWMGGEVYSFYKKNLNKVIKTKQFKIYFKGKRMYSILKILLNFRFYWIIKKVFTKMSKS